METVAELNKKLKKHSDHEWFLFYISGSCDVDKNGFPPKNGNSPTHTVFVRVVIAALDVYEALQWWENEHPEFKDPEIKQIGTSDIITDKPQVLVVENKYTLEIEEEGWIT